MARTQGFLDQAVSGVDKARSQDETGGSGTVHCQFNANVVPYAQGCANQADQTQEWGRGKATLPCADYPLENIWYSHGRTGHGETITRKGKG